MTGEKGSYPIADLYSLLMTKLDDVELNTFVLVNYPKVHGKFGGGMRKDEKINLLLDHCQRQEGGLKRLEEDVQKWPPPLPPPPPPPVGPERKSGGIPWPAWVGLAVLAIAAALAFLYLVGVFPKPTPAPTWTPAPTLTPTHTPAPTHTPTHTPAPSPCSVPEQNGQGNTEIITFTSSSCLAAKIRIDLEKRGKPEWGFSLLEVEAYGPDDPDKRTNLLQDIAVGQVCVSSIEDCSFDYYDPHNLVDGVATSRWSSNWHEPEWIEIVLQEPEKIKYIVLKWQRAYAEAYRVTLIDSDDDCQSAHKCPTPTPTAITVALQSFHDGRFVTATGLEEDWVLRTEPQPLDCQFFTLQCLDDGKISLKTCHGKYVTAMDAEAGRDWMLRAEATGPREWEQFTMVDPETKEALPCSDLFWRQLSRGEKVKIGLKTAHGKYVTAMNAENERDWMLRAETTQLGDWETFTVVPQ